MLKRCRSQRTPHINETVRSFIGQLAEMFDDRMSNMIPVPESTCAPPIPIDGLPLNWWAWFTVATPNVWVHCH